MRFYALTCLTAVAALAPPAFADPGRISRGAIVGVWTVDGGSCEGDTSEIYRADGTFGSDTYEGRWTLLGDQFTTKVERQGEIGERFKRAPERASTSTILRLTRTVRVERWRDGSVHRSHRCS
jgi:hypothetical protein